jgi:hypothetical protein
MARTNKGKTRLVDCSVDCSRAGRLDFNVRPRPGESDKQACLRRANDFAHAVDDCVTLRVRAIDGIKAKLGSPHSDDVAAAAARAQRTCREVPEDCRDACREGVSALERQLKTGGTKKIFLDGVKPGRIIRET